MTFPSLKDFKRLAGEGNLIPLMVDVSADTETPVSAYLKLTSGPFRFLLESLEGGNRWGRYSFLGSKPAFVLESQGSKIKISCGQKRETHRGDPFEMVRQLLKEYVPVKTPGLPLFAGGLVGYMGYDMIRFIEKLPVHIRTPSPFPDSLFMLQDSLVVFDNLENKLKFIVQVKLDEKKGLKKNFEEGQKRLKQLMKGLNCRLVSLPKIVSTPPLLKTNTSKAAYVKAVKRAKEYILSGDIFQVVLALCLEGKRKIDPFQVYRRLRQINPSPYLFALQMGDFALAGSSPEVMVRLEDRKVTVRPIAGTRRRGRDEDHDFEMEQEMLADPKERAEHIMLVDLARNDLGRIAKTGTVELSEQMVVEKYSHVMHLVSNVQAYARPEMDAVDVLKATFPAGTLSGAPKIRAMEVIEELEVGRRGPYGGCVGYFDFFGNMDMAITIRTMAFHKNKIFAQAGAGIVLDSIPEREYLECQNKAKVLMEALKGF